MPMPHDRMPLSVRAGGSSAGVASGSVMRALGMEIFFPVNCLWWVAEKSVSSFRTSNWCSFYKVCL